MSNDHGGNKRRTTENATTRDHVGCHFSSCCVSSRSQRINTISPSYAVSLRQERPLLGPVRPFGFSLETRRPTIVRSAIARCGLIQSYRIVLHHRTVSCGRLGHGTTDQFPAFGYNLSFPGSGLGTHGVAGSAGPCWVKPGREIVTRQANGGARVSDPAHAVDRRSQEHRETFGQRFRRGQETCAEHGWLRSKPPCLMPTVRDLQPKGLGRNNFVHSELSL